MTQYLQTWRAPTVGPNAATLPSDVRSLLAAAKKHNVSFAALRLTRALKKQLPSWYHLGSIPRRLNAQATCLQMTHKIKTVAQLIKAARRLDHMVNGRRHAARRNCACIDCRFDRITGCENPHRCAEEARARINNILPKLNPMEHTPTDGLSLTHRRQRQNDTAKAAQGVITFDPTVTCKSHLAECIRVF
ncbi:hypothetical protein FA95DRAFT_1493083, partial [Auriscalpium vulgare]